VESRHGISAWSKPSRFQPALGGNRRHTGGTRVCLPRRAVARSNRPHLNPCHRRANHRRFAAPCGSGTASHRFSSSLCYTGPHQNDCGGKSRPATVRGLWPLCPLDLRLKTEVCARCLNQSKRSNQPSGPSQRSSSSGRWSPPSATCESSGRFSSSSPSSIRYSMSYSAPTRTPVLLAAAGSSVRSVAPSPSSRYWRAGASGTSATGWSPTTVTSRP